jgi:glutamate:GABA antiporter
MGQAGVATQAFEARAVELRRAMGVFDVALFLIVSVANLQWVAVAAGTGPSALVVWVLGCVAMFVPLSIVVVYLTSQHPDEGGMYVWTRLAFGPFVGFMTGWTYWASNLSFFATVLYFAAGNALYVTGSAATLAASPVYFVTFAMLGLVFATVLNLFGLGVGKWLTNVGALCRCLTIVAVIALGCFAWAKFGSATPIDAAALRPGLALKDMIFWSVIVFALVGPELVPLMAGEIRNPKRSIPLGLALAAPVIVAIYVLGTLAVMVLVPAASVSQTSGVMQAISGVSGKFGWNGLVPLCALLVSVSGLGSAGAWLAGCSRLPFVAGIDRFLPSTFGRIDPRFGSPVTALLTLSACAAAFIVLGQGGSSVKSAYDILVDATILTTMIPFIFLFASAIKLSAGRATVIIAGLVGLATTLIAAVFSCFPANDEPNKMFAVAKLFALTLVVVVAGIAIYSSGRRRMLAGQEA